MTAPSGARAPARGRAIPPSPSWHKTRRRLVGVVFLAVLALLVWLCLLLYGKQFTPVATVTVYTSSVGNEMHVGAQVLVRGVQVGEVRQITSTGTGARLELAIQPGALPHLPANVAAEMLPTTLFGERYVDLVLPATPSARTLANGSVIGQNRSADALELQRVLNDLLPLLTSLQPDKLSVTLTALSQGLQGRGKELGQTLVTLDSYLHQLNPQLPRVDADINELARLTRSYHQALPQVLQALNDFSITGQTIADERANFAALLTTLTTASADLRAFLAANSPNIIGLSADSTSTLRILARYAPEFPCTLRDLVQFIPNINKVLGAGTKQPGVHVHVIVVPSLGKYVAGKDTPIYGDNLGPHCYPIPFPGIHLNDGAGPPHTTVTGGGTGAPGTGGGNTGAPRVSGTGSRQAGPGGAAGVRSSPQERRPPGPSAGVAWPALRATHASRADGGMWKGSVASQRMGLVATARPASQRIALPGAAPLAGSPQEIELVKELAALSLGERPAAVPGWGSLLIAPLFRGATVTLGMSRA
jgi:phospholipid/cholesterol/gamma-HCH transport system substrate-binding protein